MKLPLRLSVLSTALGLMLALAFKTSATPVTFQVNLAVQTTLGRFDPAADTVEVHGSFDGWGAGATLAAIPGSPSVFSATVDVTGEVGSVVAYKFVINQSGTLTWEDNGVGPDGAQNREISLPDAAQTLPVVYFNNQSAPPGVSSVTFQVNLKIQQALGHFDPATDTVEAHGSFDGWGAGFTLTASPTDTNVYQGSVDITGSVGTPYEYKFVINRSGTLLWEGNVGPGGGNGNRTFTLAESPQVLPVVYFDNLAVDPGAGIPVTFRVDMAVQIALGAFDPESGSVVVAGPFNDWKTDASPLAPTAAGSPVYTGTVNVKAAAGSSVPFKFVMNSGNWEGGDNRLFTLASPDQTLPVLSFNRVDNLGALTISAPVGDEFTLTWTAGPQIRLQAAAGLGAAWTDVPDSLGQGSVTLPGSIAGRIFRLVGP